MSLTYTDQAQQVTSQAFLARVQQAAIDVALSVMAESAATDGHAERADFAQQALHGDVSLRVSRSVVTNPNCGTGTDDPLLDDNALEFVISSMWNAFANYSANP